MKRFVVATVIAALCAAAVAAPVVAPAQTPSSLVVQVSTEPPGLDLTSNPASAIAGVVFDNVQEGLIKIDRTGTMVPWLAERWYTTDSKNYTFFLRKGVRFHNGRELKAADVKFALDRAVNPETKHPYRTQYDAIQDVIVKDDFTVTVALKRVDATFLYTMARQGSVIYPREAVDTAGDIDVSAFGIGPESVDELKKDARFQVIVGDTTNDVTLSMNNSKKPYSDQRVRLAITHAINKDEVLKAVMFGHGKILGSNVDPTNPYFVDVSKRVTYDPAKAKRLLAEAGYPNGFDAVFKVAPQYYYTVRSAEVIASQLAKVGIRASIQQIEWGQWLATVFCLAPCQNPDYDMSIIGHAEAWDIGNFANPKYYFRWDSAAFQKLYQDSQVTVDDKKRRDLYVKMQEMLADEAPAVWLYVHPRLLVTKKGVTGIWKDLPLPVLDLSEVAWQK